MRKSIMFAENLNMKSFIQNTYCKPCNIANINTGEITTGKIKIGEKFIDEAAKYGSIYYILLEIKYKLEPMYCSLLIDFLMLTSEIGTNIVNIKYDYLSKNLQCKKDTIWKCLKTLKGINALIKYNNKWVINPLLYFKGSITQRKDLYNKLGKPYLYIENKYIRKEFHK